jgi:hypothetical protein
MTTDIFEIYCDASLTPDQKRVKDLEQENAKLRQACNLARRHLEICQDTNSESAEVGADALTAIEKALKVK